MPGAVKFNECGETRTCSAGVEPLGSARTRGLRTPTSVAGMITAVWGRVRVENGEFQIELGLRAY